MPPIKHTQLFDFPAYQQAIKDAKTASEEFGKSIEGTIGRLQNEQKQLNAQLKEYATILKSFNTMQNGASAALKNYNKEIDNNITNLNELKLLQKGLAQVVDVSRSSVEQLEAELKGLTAQYKRLKPDQADYQQQVANINNRIKEIVPNVNAFNQALKNAKNSADVAEGSYKQMQAQLTKLRNELRNLPGAFDPVTGKLNKTNKEAVNLTKEITRLDGALKNADKQMGIYVRNVGNYERAFKGLGGSIVRTVGALIGIQSGFEALRFVFNTNLELDSLNKSLELVSGSTAEFAINQNFLKRTAENLGLEIVGLSKNFRTFFAASTTAGLSAQQTRDIFEQVSRVGANLKLSQDNLNGVFTAFGQVISKGKVQAEELRGQIGERIPGAFAIAAKAIGVTQAELNDLLKEGKVISEDFLPKFAKELENTFGGGTERMEGLQASVNRFSNALKEIAADDSGGLNQFFTKLIDFFTESLKGAEKFFQYVFDKIDPAAAKLRDVNEQFGEGFNDYNAKPLEEINQAIVRVSESVKKASRDLKILQEDFKLDPSSQNLLNVQSAKKVFDETVAYFNGIAEARRKALGGNITTTGGNVSTGTGEDASKALERRIRAEQAFLQKKAELEQKENELAFVRGEKSEKAFQERKLGIIEEYTGYAAELEQQLGGKADKARLEDLKKRLVDAQIEFEKFIQRTSPAPARVAGPVDLTGTPNTELALGSATVSRFDAELAAYELYWKERERIAAEAAQREKELLQGIVDVGAELAFASLDVIQAYQDERFERRINKLEEEKQREIDLAGSNAAARERIEFEYNRKIAREKQKQARAQKTAALFEVAINTAVGIAKTLATLGLPAALPFIAITAALGVIQAAAIAAKPIPQFKKGTKNAPKGAALINEEGFEFVEKNGRLRAIEGKNRVVNLEGGEKIYTHAESKKMLERMLFKDQPQKEFTGGLSDRMNQGRRQEQVELFAKAMERGMDPHALADAIGRHIDRIPKNDTIWDERGIIKRQRTQNQTTTYLNAQHSL